MPALGTKGRSLAHGGLAWGATNSGKSYSIGHHAVWCYAYYPGKHLLTHSNLKLMRGEIIPMVQSICLEYGIPFTPYRTDVGTFTVAGSTIVCIAGRHPGDIERLRTHHNVLTLWAEEVTGQPEEFYDMSVSRMLPPQRRIAIWAACNPSHPMNWVKRRLDEGGWWDHDQMFLVEDNPSLSEEEVEAFKAQFVGVFRKRMIEALWAAPEGLVYPHIEYVDEFETSEPCVIGVDYGESNITAAIYAQWKRDTQAWVCTREYYHDNYRSGERRSPEDHAARIIERAPGRIASGWIDPSARDLRLALESAGVPIYNGHNQVDGYETTDGMMQRGRLQVIKENCYNFELERQSLVYNRYGDRPDPNCVDHIMDATRYMACGIWEGAYVTYG